VLERVLAEEAASQAMVRLEAVPESALAEEAASQALERLGPLPGRRNTNFEDSPEEWDHQGRKAVCAEEAECLGKWLALCENRNQAFAYARQRKDAMFAKQFGDGQQVASQVVESRSAQTKWWDDQWCRLCHKMHEVLHA